MKKTRALLCAITLSLTLGVTVLADGTDPGIIHTPGGQPPPGSSQSIAGPSTIAGLVITLLNALRP